MPKISSFTAVVTPADADVVPVVQSGVTKKMALSVLKTYMGGTPSSDDAKADKVATSPDPTGYVAQFDAAGNLVKSAKLASDIHASGSDDQSLAGLATKVATSPDPTGYVAELDVTGNIVKSAKLSSAIPPAAEAENDFLIAGASPFAWAKKTLAEVLAIIMPSPGAIGETTPGTIRGKTKEIFVTAGVASPVTALTAVECAGTIVSNYGMTDADCIIDLPTAAEGLSFVCILPAVRARYFRLKGKTGSGDKIYLLGVAGSAEGYVGVATGYATGTAASFFTFKASDGGYDWFCLPIFGTFVAG